MYRGGGLCLKAYHHEKKQESQIRELGSRTEYLEGRLNQIQNYYDFQTEYRDDAYNYLAIGNSLTLITNWGRGICATKPDNDYYGLVNQYLNQKQGDVVSYRYNFAPWETTSDRASRLDLLNVFLSDKLDLVTIQLGENVADTTTFEPDLEALIAYVQQRAPKAKIIVIGDFWDKKRDAMRREAAANKTLPLRISLPSSATRHTSLKRARNASCQMAQSAKYRKQKRHIQEIREWPILQKKSLKN